MKYKVSVLCCALFIITAALSSLPPNGFAGDQPSVIPDKDLCAKMLRFGQQSYERGRYLDAKEYFRKAVQADPTSMKAWTYYDMTVIFGLAEKVEKNASLVLPDVSTRPEFSAGGLPPAIPTVPKAEKKVEKDDGIQFKIVDDEGC